MPNPTTTTTVGSFAHPSLASCLVHYTDRDPGLKHGSSERADRRYRRKLFVVWEQGETTRINRLELVKDNGKN
jgi:hypothetical protein